MEAVQTTQNDPKYTSEPDQITKYDRVLELLKSIDFQILKQFNAENKDGNAKIFETITPKLVEVNRCLANLGCGHGYHMDENGNCVPDLEPPPEN